MMGIPAKRTFCCLSDSSDLLYFRFEKSSALMMGATFIIYIWRCV